LGSSAVARTVELFPDPPLRFAVQSLPAGAWPIEVEPTVNAPGMSRTTQAMGMPFVDRLVTVTLTLAGSPCTRTIGLAVIDHEAAANAADAVRSRPASSRGPLATVPISHPGG